MANEEISLTIDGRAVTVPAGTTILAAAAAAGVEIPTLCHLKELGPYGACGVCVVEVKNCPKLLRACSALVAPGMEVSTTSDRVCATRKIAVELLMGDHDGDCQGPCTLNCPAHTDCQKYVGQIAAGDFPGAVRTVLEKIPLPASIGRVCPHPCETACRRHLVEEAISIARLKAFAGDKVRQDGTASDEKPAAATGKRVAIVGGGPAGLAAARRLALFGHAVTVYDQMPEMGGMLRWGIPAYRLPKDVLKAETDAIAALGVTYVNGFKIGRDAAWSDLRARHDALLVANGAWKSMALGCPGEDLAGVWGGIDLLREVACGKRPALGRRVAIVGGGNTAMDACRTAVRLGVEEVYIVYRRTRAEMPAEDVEIREAEEEGVKFRFLVSPVEVLGADGRVRAVKLQKMALGEPDARGRRRPEPVPGAFEELALDALVVAAGQKMDAEGFADLPLTAKGTLAADERTCATALPGVFAAGDATNRGADIAVTAVAEGNAAALAIHAYLNGGTYVYRAPVLSERRVTAADFADRVRVPRATVPARDPAVRRRDFAPVDGGLAAAQAVEEAKRCLACGCHDYADCKLIRLANACGADTDRFRGAFHPGFIERKLVSIERNQRKCILCNLCVRTCERTAKKGLLGLVDRGFKTVIRPAFDTPAATAGCRDCHLCVDTCPTGALRLLDA